MTAAAARTPASASVSIVICCYDPNRWGDLCEAVTSCLGQEPPPLEIVVVVDHEVELQRRVSAAFPSVVVVENRYARGLSGARNSGVESTAGDLIVFFDDDAVADPGMVVALGDSCLDLHVLGAVAKIEPEWIGGAPRWFPTEFLWVVGCTYRGMKPGRVRNLIGAAMCVRRSVFESVGGFTGGVGRNASRLPLGCEETELCIRANAAFPGSWFVYAPRAMCRHRAPAQRGTWRYFVIRCLAEGWSKAHIASLVDARAATSAERSYVTETLWSGCVNGVRKFVVKGDAVAAINAIAIVVGLTTTVLGYLAGSAVFMVRSVRADPLERAFPKFAISKPAQGR